MARRKSFRYKNEIWILKEEKDGWRYYKNSSDTKTIRCKGMRVAEVTE